MKISKYVSIMVRDFLVACGGITILAAIVLSLSSAGEMKASLLWQFVLGAAAFTCFKYALINTDELGKKAQTLSFYICYILADIFVILWLWFFSSNQAIDRDALVPFVIVVLVVKGMVYTMMHIDGQREAKQLNEKLSEYKNGDSK